MGDDVVEVVKACLSSDRVKASFRESGKELNRCLYEGSATGEG